MVWPRCLGAGSSPHARGALSHDAEGFPTTGIIPACAGSTLWRRAKSRPTRDHPRMRGEHDPSEAQVVRLIGSSPHARGARACLKLDFHFLGIIPGCAGSTRPIR